MIRQAITCDICASEKRQTNHWFVAHEQGGELRVTGWNSRNRLKPGSKHLCGQTCLHKLVDEFMARVVAVRAQTSDEPLPIISIPECDTSLTSERALETKLALERESNARIPVPVESLQPKLLVPRAQTEIVAIAAHASDALTGPREASRYGQRSRRAEAWDRERERESRGADRRPDMGTRLRSGA